MGEPVWRVGRKVGRTLYRHGQLVGLVDTREMAAEIVDTLNAQPELLDDLYRARQTIHQQAARIERDRERPSPKSKRKERGR